MWTTYKISIQLLISLLFLAGGAVNNGFSWFICALPFAFAFVRLVKKLPKKQAYICLSIAVITVILLGWNHSNNTLLYPRIGQIFTLSCDWGYVRYRRSYTGHDHYTFIAPSITKISVGKDLLESTKPDNIIEPYKKLPCEYQVELVKFEIDHADFGRRYEPVFQNPEGQEFLLSSWDVDDAIKSKLIIGKGVDNATDFQSPWTVALGNLMYWPIAPLLLPKLFF